MTTLFKVLEWFDEEAHNLLMANYDEKQLGNLKTHDLQKHSLTPLMVTSDGVTQDVGREARELIGCHTCNMGLEEATEVACPGGDLFDAETVFGPED